jgi:hypothetical protein
MVSGGKLQKGRLDGTPEKRLFWSIISDYDIPTALCELVDNAVDRWWLSKDDHELRVRLDVDSERQLVSIADNAGGVPEADLRYLIAPGGSKNDPDAEVIGVFGVGSKRAAMALAEHVIIRTRHSDGPTFEVEITSDWAETDDWQMPYYEVLAIEEGTTRVFMSALRKPLTTDIVSGLQSRLGATYSTFLETGRFSLIVNGQNVVPVQFDTWAYPKEQEPRRAQFDLDMGSDGLVRVSLTSGLIRDRAPVEENYGVYFYCNGRLIAKHVRDRECGYWTGSEAGVPHPDASLARTIVTLDGPAKLMPWNSSKTAINYSHAVFKEVQPTMLQLVGHFSSLSRRLKGRWEQEVFRCDSGDIVELDEHEVISGKSILLPPLPRVRRTSVEQLVSKNQAVIERDPWTLGLVEAMAAVDLVRRQSLATKNRQALILLDSNFEIALKEFIVHRTDIFPAKEFTERRLSELFANRRNVIQAVDAKVAITPELLRRAEHYYNLRNKLIHERATVDVPDADIKNYRFVVQQVLQLLFGIDASSS